MNSNFSLKDTLKEFLESNVSFDLRKQLKTILTQNWKSILPKLPPVLRREILISQSDQLSFEKCPSVFINFMLSRKITLGDVYQAFESLEIEDGLLLMGKPIKPIDIKKDPLVI